MKKAVAMIIAIGIPLLVGGISAALSMEGMASYGTMEKPPLSPPAWVFSVAWTILYIMMGIASYLVFVSNASTMDKAIALTIYGIQLAVNFMWSPIFFKWESYLFAFVWLILLWMLVIISAYRFSVVSKPAMYMMIPYVVWLTFAAYLNLGTAIIMNSKK